ncbi:hypothetical protein PQO01_12340 [Lentisphaera marina]|uniref:GHMP family kinase ATP-binding protein n=1 Tax=Lentisphaera marina TaxID=1111041 RepID=UPI002365280B|nr:hypothetical protein [Lentisphaera marina]MDD7985741.1 hypothetical protein [Lentisphaera marina]
MIISQTPLRISFLGGGTDYPPYFKRHGGATLSTTIDKYVYVTVNTLTRFFEHKLGVHYGNVEKVIDIDDLEHPAVRECLKYLGMDQGLEIHIMSDLPARTGLGSSSSFTVGLLNALYTMKQDPRDAVTLAMKSIHVEQELIGERVGNQDQCAAAFGGFNKTVFNKDGTCEVQVVQMTEQRKAKLNSRLLMFYTGIQRYADDVLDEQIKRTQEKEMDDVLQEMMTLVDKGLGILEDENRNLDEFGSLLHQGWVLKKQCSSKITNLLIDEYYDKACQAGALGGKLLGAGGGGFLLMYVPEGKEESVKQACQDLQMVSFNFESRGSNIIYED